MKDFAKSFNTLLEQYVFKVTSQFIDLIDPAKQTELINLFASIDIDSASVKAVDENIFDEPIHHLEKQWQQILSKPCKKATPIWLLELTQKRLKGYQNSIDQTCLMIHQLEVGLRRSMEGRCDEIQRVKLIAQYELGLTRNRAYLAILRSQKQSLVVRLEQVEAE